MDKQFEFIKEYLKKDSRLVVLYPDTKISHKEVQWDIFNVLENFVNKYRSLEIIQEYVTGKFKNRYCHLNVPKLSKGEINVNIYVVKEEF